MTLRFGHPSLLKIFLAFLVSFHFGSDSDAAPVPESSRDLIMLLVDKSRLTAELRTWPEDAQSSKVLMKFKIAIGKEEGDKQKEGDNKTPEGIYFTQKIIDGATLPAKYGPMAIPINFPNVFDKKLGKTGHGIWLHGVEKAGRIEEAKVTEGCVAFYNEDIMTLTRWLKPYQAVVVIAKDAQEVNQIGDLHQVMSNTKAWASAWQSRDHAEYTRFYDDQFSFKHMTLDAYKAYKNRVFSSYKNMSVDVADVRVFTHKSYAVAVMNQDFNGDDRYISNGRKLLYWRKHSSGGWKIICEQFDKKRLELTDMSMADFAQHSPIGRSDPEGDENTENLSTKL